ncbi:uncharacterized protein LOC127763798 [Oryza glaberrima]|uniref:uncharacterized protein LOC127763798 n=1 Tax=Oryza glaberrima TaxID=4538 RepID=UPI00224C3709|nr:uncharacterized protein LOC127763798 [Oryza glaberrima]
MYRPWSPDTAALQHVRGWLVGWLLLGLFEVARGRGIDGEREAAAEKVGEGEALEKSRNKNPITVEIGLVFHPPLRQCVFLDRAVPEDQLFIVIDIEDFVSDQEDGPEEDEGLDL